MSAHWKAIELQIARLLGGERVPVSGRTGVKGMESPDIAHPLWSLECKHRETVPAWIRHGWLQAEASRQDHHIAAVTILHTKGQRVDQSMVMMPLKDFAKLQTMLAEPWRHSVSVPASD